MIVRSLDSYSAYLPAAIETPELRLLRHHLSGTPEMEPRWKRAVNFVTGAMGEEIGKVYVDKYFPAQTKAEADELVQNVIAAMGRRIDQLTWMTPETKQKARAKLAAFTPKIGYP
jgi:putative endopeptidase